tara:strand:- start:1469 stop:1630 length:162 start_codon:yes stop_codon:yes gene_type:complete
MKASEGAPQDGRRKPPFVDGFGLYKWMGDGWSTPGHGGLTDAWFSGWMPLPND